MSLAIGLKRRAWTRTMISLSFCFFAALLLVNFWQTEIVRFLRTFAISEATSSIDSLPDTSLPFTLEAVKPQIGKDLHFRLRLAFRVNDTNGYPNLFQTAPGNSGIRAELSGDHVGLVFPMPGDASRLKGVVLAEHLQRGQWYHLELEAVTGDYIFAHITGYPAYRSWSDGPTFAVNHIRVGIGFDDARRFHGDIRDGTVMVGTVRSSNTAYLILYAFKGLLLAGFLISLLHGLRGLSPVGPVAKVRAVPGFYDPLLTLRFVACLMVVLGHGLMIEYRPVNLPATIGHFHWLLTASPWGGVWVFFTLSGYLMGKAFFMERYSLNREGAIHFYRNRLLRIVPLYLVAVLMVSALVHPEIFAVAYLPDILALLVFDYDGERPINLIGVLWSISTEIQFYLLVPLLFFAVGTRLRSWSSIVGVWAGFILFGLAFRTGLILASDWQMWPREVYKTLIGNLDLFACGFMTNHLVLWARGRNLRLPGRFGIGLVLVGILYATTAYVSALGMILERPEWHAVLMMTWPTVVAVMTATAIFFLDMDVQTDRSSLWARVAKKSEIMGLLTYAIYVWHEPIMVSMHRLGTQPSGFSSAMLALSGACVVILAVSLVMYNLVEVPFDRRKRYGRGCIQ